MKKTSLLMMALMATVMMSATVVTYDFTNPTSLGLTPSATSGEGVSLKSDTITVGVVAMSFSVPFGSSGAKLWTAKGPSYTLRLYQPSSMVLTSSGDNIRGIRVARSQGAITELDDNNEWRGDAKSVTLTVPSQGKANYISTVTVYVGEEMPEVKADTISVSEARARIDKGEKQACYIKGVVASAPYAASKNCVWLTDINNPGDTINGYGMRKGKASSETYKTLDEMAEDFDFLDTVLIKADGLAKYNSTYETTSGYYVETLGKAKTVYANGVYKFAFGAISHRKVEGTYVYDVVFSKVESETPDNAIHYVIKTKNEFGIKGSYKLVATGADSSYVDGEGGISGSVSFTFMGADGINNKYAVKAIFQKDGVPYVMDTTFSFCGWSKDYQEPFILEDDRGRDIAIEAIPAGAITVAQALKLANALADNDTSDVVIVTGYVVKVKEAYDTKYKNESFYLDDEIDLGGKDNLQIYRCKLDAEAILGDLMWVEGRLYKFVNKYTTLMMIKGTGHFAHLAQNMCTISTSADSQCGITAGDTTISYMSVITISATANTGYYFSQWSDGNTDNPRQIVAIGNKTYTAYFDKYKYSISYLATNGTISGQTQAYYLDNISAYATPNYGYHFVKWNDGNTNNPRSIDITCDTVFEALFAKNNYSITTAANNPIYGITLGDTTVTYLDTIILIATPNKGYHFTQWNDGSTDNPRQIQVTESKTYTAQFDKNQYTVSTSKDANITSVTGGGTYNYLDEVELTAVANANYQFDHWSDGNTDNPRILIVTQDTTLMAYSSKIRSGKCGDKLTWNYADGLLVISGTGAMYDYTQGTAPWMALYKDSITDVVINKGCTSIGSFAFYGLQNRAFTSLVLPKTVETIGAYAFANCNRLTSISLPASLLEIANYAFSGCISVDNITSLATKRPDIYENTFKDVSSYAYLYVPCDHIRSYQLNSYWNRFDLKCLGAEPSTGSVTDVTVAPTDNTVTITWPTNTNANTYTIEIKKDGITFCTLTFNAQGQLMNIAFAPGRGSSNDAVMAEEVAGGYKFTITSLTPGTKYTYEVDTKNTSGMSIANHTGTFTTKGTTTTIDQLTNSPVDQFTKIIKDGQLLILRDGKMYNAQGTEVR